MAGDVIACGIIQPGCSPCKDFSCFEEEEEEEYTNYGTGYGYDQYYDYDYYHF